MYKGCIIEVRKETMIVMTSDCDFCEMQKRQAVEEGMEIEFHRREIISPKPRTFASFPLVAAAIILFFITSIYGFHYWDIMNQSVAMVTVDINPSIQLEINHKNQVLHVLALNEEAKALPLSSLKKKSLEEALDIVLQEARNKGYILHEEENYILVTSVALKEDKENNIELVNILEKAKEKMEEKASQEGEIVWVINQQANRATLIKAEEENISVGKLKLYEALQAISDSEVNLEEIRNTKVKELIKIKDDLKIKKEHPVFKEHPGNKDNVESSKDHKEHPVFQQHPGNKKRNDESIIPIKQHPIFQQHPGQGKKIKKIEINKNARE